MHWDCQNAFSTWYSALISKSPWAATLKKKNQKHIDRISDPRCRGQVKWSKHYCSYQLPTPIDLICHSYWDGSVFPVRIKTSGKAMSSLKILECTRWRVRGQQNRDQSAVEKKNWTWHFEPRLNPLNITHYQVTGVLGTDKQPMNKTGST